MAKSNSVVDEEDLEDDEDSDAAGADKKDSEDATDEKGDEADEEEEDAEPKVRHNLSHIIARKNRTIEKLRNKKEAEDEEEDEDVEDKVGKAVRKSIEPIAKNLDEQQVSLEISTFLADPKNARFKKYERQARRYALHPAYQNVPIDGIFKQLAFDDVDSGEDEVNRKERAERQNARGSTARQAPQSDAEKIRKLQFRDKGFQDLRQRIGAGETIRLEEE